jgi:predicted transcriptional regulator
MTTRLYRGRYLIIAHMLRTINDNGAEGATKTSIMYKSYLSNAQLKGCFSFLLGKGLVEEQQSGGSEKIVYKITEKGVRLLQISNEIESIVGLD